MKAIEGIVLFVMLIAIVLLILIYQEAKTGSVECIGSPLVYGAKQLTESNDAEFSCTCSLASSTTPDIYFDQYGIEVKRKFIPVEQQDFSDFNLSELLKQ